MEDAIFLDEDAIVVLLKTKKCSESSVLRVEAVRVSESKSSLEKF